MIYTKVGTNSSMCYSGNGYNPAALQQPQPDQFWYGQPSAESYRQWDSGAYEYDGK